MFLRIIQKEVPIKANITIIATKNNRLGPAGLMGTEAPFSMVKAGVRSWILALAACNCEFMDE